MVGPVVAEPQPARLGAGRPRHDLVAEADPEQRPAVVDDGAGQGDLGRRGGPGRPGRATGSRRRRRRARTSDGRGRVREDPDAGAAMAHRPDDVGLQPEVDDPDRAGRPRRAGRTSVIDGGETWPDEVLVLPARDGPRRGHGRVASPTLARARSRSPAGCRSSAGAGPAPGCRRRRWPGSRRRAAGRPAAARRRGRRRWRWRRRAPRSHGWTDWSSSREPPVVADQRVGHDHDLAGVRRVGADLLVAGLAGVDDEVAAGRRRPPRRRCPGRRSRPRGPAAPARGRRSADRRSAARAAVRRSTAIGAITRPRHKTNPPAAWARWANACADIDASFAGLTGPVRQPHRTGHERTPTG